MSSRGAGRARGPSCKFKLGASCAFAHAIVRPLPGGGLVPSIKQVQKRRLGDASYLPKVTRITTGGSNLASARSIATRLGHGPCGQERGGRCGKA